MSKNERIAGLLRGAGTSAAPEFCRTLALSLGAYPAGRLLRDAKLYEIGAGTSEVRRMLIGRELMAETA